MYNVFIISVCTDSLHLLLSSQRNVIDTGSDSSVNSLGPSLAGEKKHSNSLLFFVTQIF